MSGGIMTIIQGIVGTVILAFFFSIVSNYDITIPFLGISLATVITTFALGSAAIIGAVFTLRKKKIGSIILVISGIISAIGVFIVLLPSQTYQLNLSTTLSTPPITFNLQLTFIDPYIMIMGGLIDLILGEKDEVMDNKKAEIPKEKVEKRKEKWVFNKLRVIGGSIVLIGCGYSFIFVIFSRLFVEFFSIVIFLLSITITIISTYGGINLILNRKFGGILSIAAGGIILFAALISSYGESFIYFDQFMIDLAPMIIGGIIGLIAKDA